MGIYDIKKKSQGAVISSKLHSVPYDSKKSQGEVFGVALLFVIIVLGVILYANFKVANPDLKEEDLQFKKYSLLAQDTLNAIKSQSTGCDIQRGGDSLEAMIVYCFNYVRSEEDFDGPLLDGCNLPPKPLSLGGGVYGACSYSMKLLNDSIQVLFSKNLNKSVLGPIPFTLYIQNPDDFEQVTFHNRTLSNFEDFNLNYDDRRNSSYYIKKGYKRVSAGFNTITTGRRNIELDLSLYYR